MGFTLLLAMAAFDAEASEVAEFWQKYDTEVLLTASSLANVAGLFPAVGTGMSLASEMPSRTWAVSSVITGSVQLSLGTISVMNGVAAEGETWLSIYGAGTVALGLGNVLLGVMNLLQHDRVIHRMNILDFAVAPMPVEDGAGAQFAFGF